MPATYTMLTRTDRFNMKARPDKDTYPAWYLEDYPSAGWTWETFPKSTDFLKALRINSDNFDALFNDYNTIDSFCIYYTANCRESVVDHLANVLVKARMFSDRFPYVYIYIETKNEMSPMNCKYINYLFSIISRQLQDFKYYISPYRQYVKLRPHTYSVGFASFLMYFMKYPSYFNRVPQVKRMRYDYLFSMVDSLLKEEQFFTRIMTGFALYGFLHKQDLGYLHWTSDNFYGNTTSGIAMTLQTLLLKGLYHSMFREYIAKYDIDHLNQFTDELSYQMYVRDAVDYHQFKVYRSLYGTEL